MKIKDESFPEISFNDFAEKHNLVLVIRERTDPGLSRYYAYFEDAETMEGGCLVGAYGNGATKEEAIKSYALRIQGHKLALRAFTDRLEIQCPNEWINGCP